MNRKVVEEEEDSLRVVAGFLREAKFQGRQGRVGSHRVNQLHRHLFLDHRRLILVPHHRTTALQPHPMGGTSTSRPHHQVIK